MGTYTEKEIKELQRVDLRMAQYFVDFCKEHELTCYFCGGGCIGAIRHKGFIPWDDDLDFFMPRESYSRLLELWDDNENKPYVLRTPNKMYNDHDMFTTIRDANTTMIKYYQRDLDIPHGVAIDIFPIDGCPSSKLSQIKQLIWALIYQIYCAQCVPHNHGKLIELSGRALLVLIKNDIIRYKIWKHAEKKMSKYKFDDCKYVKEFCAGPKYMFNVYPKRDFESMLYKDFEDTKMPVPNGYEEYLKIAFGDYMQMPPKEKRVSHHNNVIVDCHNSYLKYKGIKYCAE